MSAPKITGKFRNFESSLDEETKILFRRLDEKAKENLNKASKESKVKVVKN